MEQPRRALLYGRVSKRSGRSEQRETKSVNQQLDHGRRRAATQNWEVVDEYRDDGISASRYAATKIRPHWQEAVDAITAGRCDVLVLWEVSRATRDRLPYAMLIAACIDADVWIDVGGKLHDPSDPDDGFLLDLQAGLAIRESGVTSKRIRRDVQARAEAGTPHGKVPYGYARTYEQRPTGRVLLEQFPDPDTAPVVAELARRLLAGESAYGIAVDFDRRDIPSPEAARARRVHGDGAAVTSWRPETVRDLALSPTLAGLRVHQGNIVGEATWKPIISPADHVTLTAMLRGRGRARRHRPGAVQHLLSGIAVCGVCGTGLRHLRNRGLPSYCCPGPERRGTSCVCRSKDKLDALVERWVLRRLVDPGLLEELAASREGVSREAGRALSDLTDLRAQLAAFVAAAAEGKVSAESFGSIEAGLQRRIVDAQARIPRSSPSLAVVAEMAGPDAPSKWSGLDLDRKRVVIRGLFRVVVHRSSLPSGSQAFDDTTVEIVPL